MSKLQLDRGMRFTQVQLFEAVRLIQLEHLEAVGLPIREFVAQQDDSGYTKELVGALARNLARTAK